ncbi:MAG: CcmD family protein [Myxococcales bacterium]|nr:MAG: CcmD family protein [Myxococcales bacterium]
MKRIILLSVLVTSFYTTSSLCYAQDNNGTQTEQEQSVADSRADSFQTVSGPQKDEVSGGALMLGAYTVLWVGLLLYLLKLGKRSKTLEIRLGQLEKELNNKA